MDNYCTRCRSKLSIRNSFVYNDQPVCSDCLEKLDNPTPKIHFKCNNCGKSFTVDESMSGKTGKCNNCGERMTIPGKYQQDLENIKRIKAERFTQYKVVTVEESGCGTVLLGSSMIPEKKMEMVLNDLARHGWQVVFQIIEKRRYLLFWTRESVIITLGR